MFKKIVVCLDGSSLAEKILPYVTEGAVRFNTEVILLRVLDIPSTVAWIEGAPTAPTPEAMVRKGRLEVPPGLNTPLDPQPSHSTTLYYMLRQRFTTRLAVGVSTNSFLLFPPLANILG